MCAEMFVQTALGCITVSVAGLCSVHAGACRLNVPASVKVTCTRTAAHQQIAAACTALPGRPAVCLVAVVGDVVIFFLPHHWCLPSCGHRRHCAFTLQISQVALFGKLSCEWRSLTQHNAAHFSFFLSPLLLFRFFLSSLQRQTAAVWTCSSDFKINKWIRNKRKQSWPMFVKSSCSQDVRGPLLMTSLLCKGSLGE